MIFNSFFKKKTVRFDEEGYTNSFGYSDYTVIMHRGNEVESFIWANKDKETIRIQALINNKFERVEYWGSKLTYFNIKEWSDSEDEQKQMISELLFGVKSDRKDDFMDDDWTNIVIKHSWERVHAFMNNLNYIH